MKAKFTDSTITELKDNEIFVFGSNKAGNHAGGAAKQAIEFGAKIGVGGGLCGQTYAIATLSESFDKIPLEEIQIQINLFEKTVKQRTDLHFHITAIGCGIAGFSVKEIAPMFAGFQDYENVSLPKEFIDFIGEDVIYGFKAANFEVNESKEITKIHCRGFEYKIGNVYVEDNTISICNNGFHFCEKLIDTLNYYSRNDDVLYLKVIGCGQIQNEDNKHCVSVLKIVEIFNHSHDDFNTGDWNTGNSNTGNSNTGNWNTGNRNTGYRNTGNRNTGDWNNGNRNTGYWNTGNRNTGNSNTGNMNTGNWNTGYSNTGNRNTGNWNTGNRNTGYMNTITPDLIIFNKPTKKKIEDIYFPSWMFFDLIVWKNSNELSIEEKTKYPEHEICGGILIKKDYKKAAQESYNNATEQEKRSIEDLPNYDAEILFEIFGIDRRK